MSILFEQELAMTPREGGTSSIQRCACCFFETDASYPLHLVEASLIDGEAPRLLFLCGSCARASKAYRAKKHALAVEVGVPA